MAGSPAGSPALGWLALVRQRAKLADNLLKKFI
jgi:hypothetical protein